MWFVFEFQICGQRHLQPGMWRGQWQIFVWASSWHMQHQQNRQQWVHLAILESLAVHLARVLEGHKSHLWGDQLWGVLWSTPSHVAFPTLCLTQMDRDSFKVFAVNHCRLCQEFCHCSDGKANMWATCHGGTECFAKQCAMGESHLFLWLFVFC